MSMSLAWVCGSLPLRRPLRRPGYCAYDQQEDHTADKGDDDASNVYSRDTGVPEVPEHPSADDRTDDADDKIANQPARALAFDNHAPEPTADYADDDPG